MDGRVGDECAFKSGVIYIFAVWGDETMRQRNKTFNMRMRPGNPIQILIDSFDHIKGPFLNLPVQKVIIIFM